MRIAITTSSFDVGGSDVIGNLEKRGVEIIVNPYGRRLTSEEAIELLQGVTGVIAGVEPLTSKVLTACPNLRVISRCGVGLDNVDTDAATRQGILVKTTPEAPAGAVAELTISLVLALLRRIVEADRIIRAGEWKPLMGRMVSECTVGIIGYGRVGRRVAELLTAFGANVLVSDPVVRTTDYKQVSLSDLLDASDVVTLHLPLSAKTRNLIGRSEISKMKRGALLINASRGGLVDEDALYDALVSGELGGAALDAYASEPYSGLLTTLPQVVLTAHMGSYALSARRQMETESAENLVASLQELNLLEEH